MLVWIKYSNLSNYYGTLYKKKKNLIQGFPSKSKWNGIESLFLYDQAIQHHLIFFVFVPFLGWFLWVLRSIILLNGPTLFRHSDYNLRTQTALWVLRLSRKVPVLLPFTNSLHHHQQVSFDSEKWKLKPCQQAAKSLRQRSNLKPYHFHHHASQFEWDYFHQKLSLACALHPIITVTTQYSKR